MKNTWNILFVLFLLIETACNSPSQSIKNTDLVAEDSICFPIDEHTYYASKKDRYSCPFSSNWNMDLLA